MGFMLVDWQPSVHLAAFFKKRFPSDNIPELLTRTFSRPKLFNLPATVARSGCEVTSSSKPIAPLLHA